MRVKSNMNTCALCYHLRVSINKDVSLYEKHDISNKDTNQLTVMIRFSARGAYLLLASQGRALIRDRVLIRGRALI